MMAGLWASNPQSDGVMFVACEPPIVSKELINSLIETFKSSVASIVAANVPGRPPNPLLFRRELFTEILELRSEDIAASLIEKHPKRTVFVQWQEQPGPATLHGRPRLGRLKERV